MIEVRTKDKIFLAVLVPLALVACHFHFLRAPEARRLAVLRTEQARLPDIEQFPAERRRLEKRLLDARAALDAARAEKPPEAAVRGSAEETVAARHGAAVRTFAEAGLRVVRVETVSGGASRGDAVLQGTGVRPAPAARRFVLEGDYGAFLAALGAWMEAKAAVVPESVSMEGGAQTCRWEVTLWL